MDTKLNGNEIIGIILIIISAILLLTGNFIEELWPMTDKFFESSFLIFLGILGLMSLAVGRKKKRQSK